MKRLMCLRIGTAAALALMVLTAATVHAGPPKVTVCHKPPGNPGNAHTIHVNIHAWPAHQAHGDSLGECNPADDPDPGSESGGGGAAPGAFAVLLCDGRSGQHGRHIRVTETGRVHVQQAQCQ